MGKIKGEFKFIDLFAGIGGFHLAMHKAGGVCVFASEWDKYARITYEHNFSNISPRLFKNNNFNIDINDAVIEKIPNFDVLCAGFPCQPFSHAGLKKGFEDTRGTLFFKIAEIINYKVNILYKPPKVILLENVKGLKGHDKGNTLKTIVEVLNSLGYEVRYKILNSKHFGIPQNRERLFIVAWLKTLKIENFNFPIGKDRNGKIIFSEENLSNCISTRVGDILQKEVDPKYTISDTLYIGHKRRKEEHKIKGNGFGFSLFNEDSPHTSTISARYYKDGSEILIKQKNANPRKLIPKEAGLLQGYPIGETYEIVVSDVQAYKQFGNSVSVPVVTSLALEIKKQLLKKK
jgi:DNA (cytosine-5)-methyltransferase 1